VKFANSFQSEFAGCQSQIASYNHKDIVLAGKGSSHQPVAISKQQEAKFILKNSLHSAYFPTFEG